MHSKVQRRVKLNKKLMCYIIFSACEFKDVCIANIDMVLCVLLVTADLERRHRN